MYRHNAFCKYNGSPYIISRVFKSCALILHCLVVHIGFGSYMERHIKSDIGYRPNHRYLDHDRRFVPGPNHKFFHDDVDEDGDQYHNGAARIRSALEEPMFVPGSQHKYFNDSDDEEGDDDIQSHSLPFSPHGVYPNELSRGDTKWDKETGDLYLKTYNVDRSSYFPDQVKVQWLPDMLDFRKKKYVRKALKEIPRTILWFFTQPPSPQLLRTLDQNKRSRPWKSRNSIVLSESIRELSRILALRYHESLIPTMDDSFGGEDWAPRLDLGMGDRMQA